MKLLRRSLWLAATILLMVRPSGAQDVGMRVSCPAEAAARSTMETDLRFENRSCVAAEIRLSSSIAGNPLGNFGAIGIFGPVVAAPTIRVPAGAGPFCASPPGITDVAVSTPPEIPESLVGTVATLFLIAEWDDGFTGGTLVEECLVNVRPVCFGDLNQDGTVNNADARLFRGCYPCPPPQTPETCDPACDSNGDGVVDAVDLAAFRANFAGACP